MKILIIGSGPNWKDAPFWDESFDEVWSYGMIADCLPRVTRVFEMHARKYWTRQSGVDSEAAYVKRLNELSVPVFMCEKHSDIRLSARYPLERVEEMVGPHFASTLSYQLGLAILHNSMVGKVEEIALWGFDLMHWEEWAYQRPNVNRLIGFAQGQGIRITVPDNSRIVGVAWKYGYERDEESVTVSQAVLDEDYGQLASLMNRIADHNLAMAKARENERVLRQHNAAGLQSETSQGHLNRGQGNGCSDGEGVSAPGWKGPGSAGAKGETGRTAAV